jgi:peptide/nickel transport system substrate-binding protein
LPEIELLYNASPTVEQVVTWIQDALRRVGFRIRLSAVSFPEYLARIARGDFDIYRDNFPAEHAAMESFYGIFYGPYRAPPGLNTTRFSDLQYDLFFKRLLQTVEPSDRLVLATRLEGRLADTAPATFLFHPVRYRLVRPEIRRLPLSPLGRTVLERCWKQQAGEQLREEEPLNRDRRRGSGP